MGCGCGGGGVRGVGRRPIVGPRSSVSRGIPRSPRQLEALERNKGIAPPITARQLAAQTSDRSKKRMQIERKRRLAIAAKKRL